MDLLFGKRGFKSVSGFVETLGVFEPIADSPYYTYQEQSMLVAPPIGEFIEVTMTSSTIGRYAHNQLGRSNPALDKLFQLQNQVGNKFNLEVHSYRSRAGKSGKQMFKALLALDKITCVFENQELEFLVSECKLSKITASISEQFSDEIPPPLEGDVLVLEDEATFDLRSKLAEDLKNGKGWPAYHKWLQTGKPLDVSISARVKREVEYKGNKVWVVKPDDLLEITIVDHVVWVYASSLGLSSITDYKESGNISFKDDSIEASL